MMLCLNYRWIFLSFTVFAVTAALAQTPTPTPGPVTDASLNLAPSPTPALTPDNSVASPTPSPAASATPNWLTDIPAPAQNVTPLPTYTPMPTPAPYIAPGSGAADETMPTNPTAPSVTDTLPLPAPQKDQNQQLKSFEITPRSLDSFLNPKLPKMTLDDTIAFALKNNTDILNAIQQIRNTSGQLIQVVSQVVPNVTITSSFNQQAQALANP
ncbi:MAG: hypothetical protein ABIP97_12485, partial [Chthoniobacterales bacterium]